ncbi:hypothetical protein BO83DRAFT_240077 [Aspergillus eucalypticola CBS 122712]|uniref:Uncharacterized protein n=1 Tax=Aspergillus eucalypticola (strain CBS 122712 / IBT 29274) TaxID=1448314 RepID=A0A317VR02_ASPEC|nr:uncharacterized protein BO83DRAFT_240077 [Aspergillus eucalypticola CBS 122712]PWY76814.1 hypothetical protein BO83DRAFT_240077 [Aspergillus eucalypticola CBS 122712]
MSISSSVANRCHRHSLASENESGVQVCGRCMCGWHVSMHSCCTWGSTARRRFCLLTVTACHYS